jgi:hypothetical protein
VKSRRLRIGLCAAAAILAAAEVADAASAKDVPTIDLQTRCRKSEKIMADMMGESNQRGSGFDVCMRSEQDARKALVAAWPEVPPSYKDFCVRPAAYSPSYVEWIACLELLIDLRKLRGAAKP